MTLLVIAFVVSVVLIYDLCVVLFADDVNATVSNTVYQACRRAPIIAFIFGVICGHLFWPITHFSGRPFDAKANTQMEADANGKRQ